MNISAKSKYAVRALVELAERAASDPDKPVRLTDIAAGREIPLQFLEQLFSTLRRAGLLRSQRGVSGGYLFARPPEQVSVLNVVEALDGLLTPATCTQGECAHLVDCGVASVWIEAKDAVEQVLAGSTIADLVERERRLRVGAAMDHV